MGNFENSARENHRRRQLSAVAAAGVVAMGGLAELSRPAAASAEKAKNPMISRIDGRMVRMVKQIKALKKDHPMAVGIESGIFEGKPTTDYILTMREKNLQGQNSYSVLYMITPKDKDLPFYSVFVPISPTINPDITATPKPADMEEMLRFQAPNVYLIDSYGPDGKLVGKVPITDSLITNKKEADTINAVYDDLTSFMEEFIQSKIASYKPVA